MAKTKKKLSDFNNYSEQSFLDYVCEEAGEEMSDSLAFLAKRLLQIPEYSCSVSIKEGEGIYDYAKKWTRKYINAKNNRASKRTSNTISTQRDAIVDTILKARITDGTFSTEDVQYGHRLAMSAENLAGPLLEEYLATELEKHGWHCCWGEVFKSIDFCHTSGKLLQIKNSDNSENSSSKAIRDGTPIEHWFRRFSKTGATNWEELNKKVGLLEDCDKLSEEKFHEFVKKTVSENPMSIVLEPNSPWYTQNSNN